MRLRINFVFSGLLLWVCTLAGQNTPIPANSLVVIDLPDHSRMANVKDTTYTRVLDGLFIPPGYSVSEAFREVAYVGNMDDVKLLGVKSSKPLMLINTKNFEIEMSIDSLLDAQKNGPDYPSYVKLPLALNGKVMSHAEKLKTLPTLKIARLTSVKYLNPEETRKKYSDTPFGLIDLTTSSFK